MKTDAESSASDLATVGNSEVHHVLHWWAEGVCGVSSQPGGATTDPGQLAEMQEDTEAPGSSMVAAQEEREGKGRQKKEPLWRKTSLESNKGTSFLHQEPRGEILSVSFADLQPER